MRIQLTPVLTARSLAMLAACMLLTACASLNKKEKGAVIGAGVGGAIGGVIGNNTGSTARGAILGAIVGGTAGAVIGHQMDQQAKELQQDIPGATITRVGEGIVVTFASGLLYDVDSDVLRSSAAINLSNLASSLDKFPQTDLMVVGHTDATGTSDYNQSLSQRRSTSASNYLMSKGVSSGRLQTSGRGEMEPIAPNDTEAGRQANRRVEIAIFANASTRKSASQ